MMIKKLIFPSLAVIISSLVSSMFIFDSFFGFDIKNPVAMIIKLSIIFTALFLFAWISYSKLISYIFRKNFTKILIKDSITYLPFIFLGLFPLKYFASSLESKFMQFSYLPSALIFTFAFSFFVLLKVFFSEIKIGNKKSLRNIVFIIILIFFLTLSALSILKHNSFFSTGFDLGIYDQTMYGYSKGKIFDSISAIPILGDHIQWILFLIIPVYLLFPSVISLLLIQSFFICAGTFILYLISKDILKNKLASLIVCITYLMYHAVHYTILFDFHPIVLSVPFIFLSLYALINKKYKLLVVSLFLAGICKEYLALILVPFGIFLFFSKKRALGCIIAVVGIIWFIVNLNILIPYFYGRDYFYFTIHTYFGESLFGIIKTLLFNPAKVLVYLATLNKLSYIILFLAPVFFGIFALFAPEFLFLGITELAIILLHSQESLSQILYHHQITLVPFVMVATVIGMKRLSEFVKNKNMITAGSFCILSAAVISNIFIGPFAILYDLNDFNINEQYVHDGKEILGMIPKDASVIAPNWVIPHLSQREHIYMLRYYLLGPGNNVLGIVVPDTDYIVADVSDAFTDPARAAQFPLDKWSILFTKEEYGIIAVKDSWILLKKGASYEKGICKIKPFLNKKIYPYLDIKIEDNTLLEKC